MQLMQKLADTLNMAISKASSNENQFEFARDTLRPIEKDLLALKGRKNKMV